MRIANCPEVAKCLTADSSHPCFDVVSNPQGSRRPMIASHQPTPEPWVGHLERAVILFIGPNPGSAPISDQPPPWFANYGAEEATIRRVTADAFDLGPPPRFTDGSHWKRGDGTIKYEPHYGFIYRRACELMENPRPGIDYAITDVVKCGSFKQAGVTEAAIQKCCDLYLDDTLALSPARLFVTLGAIARRTMMARYGLTGPPLSGPTTIQGRDRYVIFLPHPSQPDRKPRLDDRIQRDDLMSIKRFLRSSA